MKNLFFTMVVAVAFTTANAQTLVPDQNPNYKQSMDKYAATQTSLQSTMNTTVQSTYKAYDWSTAKAERKAERLAFRRERALNNRFFGYNGYNDFDDFGYNRNNFGFNNGFNNNYNYNNNFRNRSRNNWNNNRRNNCYWWW